MSAFLKAHFNYSSITWMFHSRPLNKKINRLHERCLRIIFNDKVRMSVSIHHNSIHSIAIEMSLYTTIAFIQLQLKCTMSLMVYPSSLYPHVFQIRNNTHYNLRYAPTFLTEPIHSVLVVNQHHIWDSKYGNKYLMTSKQ